MSHFLKANPMIQAATAPPVASAVIKFPALLERESLDSPAEPLTLRTYYEGVLLPDLIADIEEQDDDALSQRSLSEDRCAINNWERYTENRTLEELSEVDLKKLKNGMLRNGKAVNTVAKTWRELAAIFRYAVDDGFLKEVPQLKRKSGRKKRKKGIVTVQKTRQREILTLEEVASLWEQSQRATYPATTPSELPASKLWRVALVLFFTYGQRTLDVFTLKWEDVRFGDRTILFKAMKTGKLQGLPMTELVERHLRSIEPHCTGSEVFQGFRTAGNYNRKTKRWKAGYYTTWRREITRHATLKAPVQLKNFRQRVVNEYNSEHDGIKLGSWIAGHSIPGVSAQNYELPTRKIREAIEAAPVPDCFHEVG